MSVRGTESQTDSNLGNPHDNAAASYASSEASPKSRTPTPQSSGESAPVKQEVEDDMDLDSRNMANAPFVNKLWRIVNDPANHKYIRWVSNGKSIQIVDREGVEKQLLPFYFKHKQFTSFVRQLNMYGWHKVQDMSAGTMQSSEEHWQFTNPNFIQGHPELLRKIVRKGHKRAATNGENARDGNANNTSGGSFGNNGSSNSSAQGADSDVKGGSRSRNAGGIGSGGADESDGRHDFKAILRELEQIKARQIHIGEDLGRMRKDNELLWTEYYQTRERYDKHSQMLSRILRFLATVYGNQSKILDLSNPNSPASAAAERVLRGPLDGHHLSPQQHQQYLGLLPANEMDRISPADTIESSIHDLREIEQMQHQIEETNTPSSKSPSVSGGESIGTRESNNDISLSTPGGRTGTPGSGTIPGSYGQYNAAGSTNLSTPRVKSADLNRALIPSRRTSQAVVGNQAPIYTAAPSPRRVSQIAAGPASSAANNVHSATLAQPNNQLVRAGNYGAYGSPVSVAPHSQYPPQNAHNNTSSAAAVGIGAAPPSQSSPQLQEIPENFEDPDRLFPELEDLAQAPNMPPLTNNELEQISREVANNGMSLQNIQDWLAKQNLDNYNYNQETDDQFNVDDFLSTEDASNHGAADPKTAKGSTNLTEPERKRTRVN